jgi:hypothetical protein
VVLASVVLGFRADGANTWAALGESCGEVESTLTAGCRSRLGFPLPYAIAVRHSGRDEATSHEFMPTHNSSFARVMSERQALEALQRRASLNNPGDRDALLANPDAIELPPDQIAAGHVFIAERNGAIVGFSAVLPREGPEMDLDGLFVEPHLWRHGIGRLLVE